MPDLPTGTITFLFTDIEGSTTRWEHYPEVMRTSLARHDALLRQVITAHGGFVFKMVGDAVYAAFAVPADGVAAAVAAQRAVAAEEWGEVGPLRVRMALHTGAAQSRDDDYFGPTLNRVARVLSTGYGGQILLSVATVELVRDALPAGMSLKDLGEHALKDLLRPEHVFQLTIPDLAADFPALKSLSYHPHNLPAQPTPFLGRQQEVASVCALLSRSDMHLVTLTGPGGIGKTRLGLQVVAELADQFADGVWFVPLAPLSDAALVVPTIMQALSISEAGTQPLLAQLKAALKDKHLLLLLDNFEQVVSAAAAVAELLTSCPKLRVLVTSRVVLRVRAEREFNVPPLSQPDPTRLPDLGTLSQYEAVALFIERAQAVKPDFVVTNANAPAVAGICARLDGLPLAIELAAARSKLLPPQALLARLSQRLALLTSGARDVPARHQTLRNTIAWSYDLLGAGEQHLFRRLSVFVSGCTLEAIEAVCTAPKTSTPTISLLDGMASLLDKSLLQQREQEGEEPRLVLLETIREYGLETLEASGEAEAIRQAHAVYYLRLAQQAEPELVGSQQDRWLERLEQEHDNLRAALGWALEEVTGEEARESRELALRLSAALEPFWVMHGHYSEARTFLERVLAGSEAESASLRARVLQATAEIAELQGDYDRAEVLAQRSLALYRELGDTRGIANSLFRLAVGAGGRGESVQSLALCEERVRLMRHIGEPGEIAHALFSLADEVSFQGEYARGQSLFEEALLLFRKAGNELWVGATLVWTASWLLRSAVGDMATVRQRLQQGQAHITRVGHRPLLAFTSIFAAQVALSEGETARAYDLAQESLAIHQEMGYRRQRPVALWILGRVEAQRSDLRAACSRYMESLALAQEMGAKWIIPFNLEGLADVLATQGELRWAAQLWGAAEVLREETAYPLPPVDRPLYEQAVATARAQLGEPAFAAAWTDGRATPLERVITDVLKMKGEAGTQ